MHGEAIEGKKPKKWKKKIPMASVLVFFFFEKFEKVHYCTLLMKRRIRRSAASASPALSNYSLFLVV